MSPARASTRAGRSFGRPAFRNVRGSWLRVPAAIALVMVLAAGGAGCGQVAPAQDSILTVVRVEQELPDGTWAPAEGVKVEYQIWAGTTHNAQVSLYHEYQDDTDAQGLSAVNRDPGDKSPAGIGMVFIDVTHPDGRTSFRRAPAQEFFDFDEWSQKFPSGAVERSEIVEKICATAVDFPDCDKKLDGEELKTWGVGFIVRFRKP
ncbi:MAG: hypothetical protein OXG46_09120 [Chloroflexi bacterium]|nr:hypothetical protein [Chloroflexota bacterium]MCY3938388.1 hypothetical protein [Chloroflexota bacterium]